MKILTSLTALLLLGGVAAAGFPNAQAASQATLLDADAKSAPNAFIAPLAPETSGEKVGGDHNPDKPEKTIKIHVTSGVRKSQTVQGDHQNGNINKSAYNEPHVEGQPARVWEHRNFGDDKTTFFSVSPQGGGDN